MERLESSRFQGLTAAGLLTQKVKGVDRDGRRLVTGSDGSAFYTTDHYLSFIQIR